MPPVRSAVMEVRVFSIGEFSKISGMTVKTLRFYHEEGLFAPAFIDPQTGYRYYDQTQIETARAIAYLRGLEFPLCEIREMLRHAADEDLLDAMQRQRTALEGKIKQYRKAVRSLDEFISQERQAQSMSDTNNEVQEKTIDPILIAGIRMKGCYGECGKGFAKICRSFGRYASGRPMMLHYDTEYKDCDADFEACIPISQAKTVEGISVQELPGGRCVTLIHKGPYEQLGHSYARILKYVKDKGYKIASPTREVYIKGPGMIFKGNPKNYLTEIQMLIAS